MDGNLGSAGMAQDIRKALLVEQEQVGAFFLVEMEDSLIPFERELIFDVGQQTVGRVFHFIHQIVAEIPGFQHVGA